MGKQAIFSLAAARGENQFEATSDNKLNSDYFHAGLLVRDICSGKRREPSLEWTVECGLWIVGFGLWTLECSSSETGFEKPSDKPRGKLPRGSWRSLEGLRARMSAFKAH